MLAHFALGFPSPPVQKTLGSPRTITRRLIMQKASSHPAHLNFVQMVTGCRFSGYQVVRSGSSEPDNLITFNLQLGSFGKGQMSRAPTHCMQSVAGTISLP